MVSTWKSCGLHIVIMLCQHGNHMVSTWKLSGVHMETTWFLWLACTSLKLVMLFLWVEMMSFPWWDTTRWKQCHFHIISMGGNDVSFIWKPSGFYGLPGLWLEISLESTNFVVSLLFPCHFHGFHIDIMWFPGQHDIVSNVDTMWFSNGHHVVSMFTLHGFNVNITSLLRFPHDFHRWKCHFCGEIPQDGNNIISTGGNNVISRWKPHGFYVLPQLGLEIIWKLQISWFPCCLYVISMVSIWTPCDFKCRHPVVSNVDTIYGFHTDPMWCPGNDMETNTRNSSAWSQLVSLLGHGTVQFVYIFAWFRLVKVTNGWSQSFQVEEPKSWGESCTTSIPNGWSKIRSPQRTEWLEWIRFQQSTKWLEQIRYPTEANGWHETSVPLYKGVSLLSWTVWYLTGCTQWWIHLQWLLSSFTWSP